MKTPKEWIDWVTTVKAFYSSRGAILSRIIVSMDIEGSFFMAAIENPDKYPEIDALGNRLHGVQIVFTTKLPADRALFESVADRGKYV